MRENIILLIISRYSRIWKNESVHVKYFVPICALIILNCTTLDTYCQSSKYHKPKIDSKIIFSNITGERVKGPEWQMNKTENVTKQPHIYNTDNGTATVNPNFRIHPGSIDQSDVSIVSSAANRSWLFASSFTFNSSSFLFSEGIYISTNGGQTWFGSDTCGATPLTNQGLNPSPAIGPNGTIYITYNDLYSNGIHCGVSADWGQTWGSAHNLVYGQMESNNAFVNDVLGSVYFNRVLVSWSDFTKTLPPIMVCWSSDDGASWSTAFDINTADSGHYCQGVNGAVAPNGDFYLVWQNSNIIYPHTGEYIGFAKSIDGGATWYYTNNVYDCNGIRGFLFSSMIRVGDFPSIGVDRTNGIRSSWIYVVTAEKNLVPAGSDPDIIMHRSTDGGNTWSAGIRVNQDVLNNGKYQYMPSLTVGTDGSISVVYYDTRNCSGDSAEIYISHSVDGGNTWMDLLVSDHRFKPKPITGLEGGYQGDYIGITEASNGIYYPVWCDDYTGIYQAWTSAVTFEPPCAGVEPPYNPNPPNGAEDISANLSELNWINGAGTITDEIYFGTDPDNLPLMQSGILTNSYALTGTLNYSTTYYWRIVEVGDTCSTAGTTWYFTTQPNPSTIMITVPVLNVLRGTGYCGSGGYTNCEINTMYPNEAWAIFDLSSISVGMPIDSIRFWGYVNDNYWPFWSATPMGSINPVIDGCPEIISQIQANSNQGTAYIFSNENSTLNNGWHSWALDPATTAIQDFENAELQGWFAMGFVDRDYSPTYFINFDGYCQSNPPYLEIWTTVPVELISFTASANQNIVTLNWSTSTETNNRGFEIEKSQMSTAEGVSRQGRKLKSQKWLQVGFVEGKGTTTESHCYTFTDKETFSGSYQYRLKQIDFDGSYHYSNIIEVSVTFQLTFSLDQNYPNPFNPTTAIDYSIAKDGNVSLKIYNVLGQQVADLVNGNMKAGLYHVTFDAAKFASGVYYYRLQEDNNVMIKKMVLIK